MPHVPYHERLLISLRLPLIFLSIVIVGGTSGYMMLWREDASEPWLELASDALYMTLITITTVGYGEVRALEHKTRLFTMAVAIFGIANLTYIFSSFMEFLVSRQLQDPLGKGKMQRLAKEFRGHIIVAGYGQMGQRVCKELQEHQTTFVLVESHPDILEDAIEKGIVVIEGDATLDETLLDANILNAKALIATTSDDASNAFVAMSARALNPNLRIVARADSDDAIKKLLRAGADAAVNPYTMGSNRLTKHVLHPSVVDFFETSIGSKEISVEELIVRENTALHLRSIGELDLRRQTGISVLVMFRDDKPLFPPPLNEKLRAGDRILVMASAEQLGEFKGWLEPDMT